MDEVDLADWKICWRVNLLYYKLVTVSQNCIKCSETYVCPEGTSTSGFARRSSFWIDATRCSAGHRQALSSETKDDSLGVCAKCDRMYMFELIKGDCTCRREGCRRVVRVNEAEIKEKLAFDTSLFKEFQSMVQKHRVYECLIHCDEVPYDTNLSQAFKPPTPSCDHDRNICDECNTAAFENAIRNARYDDLVCLDPECKKPIPLSVIRSSVSADLFKIYNKHLSQKAASNVDNFRWCDCGHGQIHEPRESNPEWFCLLETCKKRNCYICKSSQLCTHLQAIDRQKVIKERNQSEKQAAARILLESARNAEEAQKRAVENATMQEMARISKRCPKAGCPNKIERDEGCGHFTCEMCKTEFCWCCKVIWVEGVDKKLKVLHLKGCKIGTSRQVFKNDLDQTGYKPGWDVDAGYDLSLDKGLWLLTKHM